MMFHIAICDDDERFIEYEMSVIKEYEKESGIKMVIKTYESGEAFVSSLTETHCDLVLLDCEMLGMSGFETAKKIRALNSEIAIAFVTVFYDFSREGYRFNAIRYLVKQEKTFKIELIDCINTVFQRERRKIIRSSFRFTDGVDSVVVDKIVCILSNKHYLDFHIDYGSEVRLRKMRGKISNVQLDNDSFIIVRQGVMINLKYVEYIKTGLLHIKHSSGFSKTIHISDSHKEEVVSRFLEYKEMEDDT